jgi:hypothetical protein
MRALCINATNCALIRKGVWYNGEKRPLKIYPDRIGFKPINNDHTYWPIETYFKLIDDLNPNTTVL